MLTFSQNTVHPCTHTHNYKLMNIYTLILLLCAHLNYYGFNIFLIKMEQTLALIDTRTLTPAYEWMHTYPTSMSSSKLLWFKSFFLKHGTTHPHSMHAHTHPDEYIHTPYFYEHL